MTSAECKEWLTFLLALYGAMLASWNIFVQRRDKFPRAKVTSKFGLRMIGNTAYKRLVVQAVNTGDKPISLSHFHFELADGQHLTPFQYDGDERLPKEITHGQCCKLALDLEQVQADLACQDYVGKLKMRAVFCDAAGNEYKSKSIVLDIKA